MISRSAESCFWLYRYVERAHQMARLVAVNDAFVLDVPVSKRERWLPVVIVSGEQARFAGRKGVDAYLNPEAVLDYLTWDIDNPVSIFACVSNARESARTVREIISVEMWNALNAFWLWLNSPETRADYLADRAAFFQRVEENCYLLYGVTTHTITREQPYNFMILGLALERAGQIGRILDVNYHRTSLRSGQAYANAIHSTHWLTVLRFSAALESYFKRNATLSREKVMAFLLYEPALPLSVRHCLDWAEHEMRQITGNKRWTGASSSLAMVQQLLGSLPEGTRSLATPDGLHVELTRIVDAVASVCEAVAGEFFHPETRNSPSDIGDENR